MVELPRDTLVNRRRGKLTEFAAGTTKKKYRRASNRLLAGRLGDDQEATVYESGSFEFVTNNIPKLKIGQRIGEQMLKRLNRLKANAGMKNDLSFFTDYENQMAENLVIGIRQRVNALICAMQMDSLTYNRFGIKLTNSNWGTPADLKATVSTGWDSTSATPLTDIQVMAQEYAPDVYGEQYDRITMSRRLSVT